MRTALALTTLALTAAPAPAADLPLKVRPGPAYLERQQNAPAFDAAHRGKVVEIDCKLIQEFDDNGSGRYVLVVMAEGSDRVSGAVRATLSKRGAAVAGGLDRADPFTLRGVFRGVALDRLYGYTVALDDAEPVVPAYEPEELAELERRKAEPGRRKARKK